jgi:dihydropyrimidine dehydrogenase (NAD+) subunit PreA
MTRGPRLRKFPLNALQNVDGYSEYTIEEWEPWLVKLKHEYPSIPIIVSITSGDPGRLAGLASAVESLGADGLQIDLSCPHHFSHGTGEGSTSAELTKRYITAVRQRVKIPIFQKLTYNVVDITEIAKAAVEAGVDGLVAIDTVRSLIGIDIDQGRPFLPAFGGLSGPAIKPLSLFSVASVAKAVTAPISASGGIATWRDVIEFMMAGASSVQLCTVIMWEGYGVISEILAGLNRFVEERGCKRASNLIGMALPHLKGSVSEIPSRPPFEISVNRETCARSCRRCVDACLAGGRGAISKEIKGAIIDLTKCDGCGLCVGVCPTESITLRTKDV